MSIGNVVFADANNNGRYDAGEGVDGVWMILQSATGTVATPLAQTFTANGGRYLFSNLLPGSYIVHVAADNFKENISIGGGAQGPGPLFRKLSVSGAQTMMTLDDNLGEDGIDAANPEQVGISSGVIALQQGAAPTGAAEGGFDGASDDASDSNVDLTVDFGFATRMGVGNLVFNDVDGDGRFNPAIDNGVDGVVVQALKVSGTTVGPVVASTVTSNGGLYTLYVPSGNYQLRIPAAEFAPGGHFVDHQASIYAASVDDNAGQDALWSADPVSMGIVSPTVTLTSGAQPIDSGAETGVDRTSDNADDSNVNLTIDFGLRQVSLSVGNMVFNDVNGDGKYNTGEGVPAVQVRLFAAGADPKTATPAKSTTTSSTGKYLFTNVASGSYFVHILAVNFQSGGPLYRTTSLRGFQSAASGADDNLGEDGIDDQAPEINGISCPAFIVQTGMAPYGVGELGFEGATDDTVDSDVNLTIDFGFATRIGLGNIVFKDLNADGVFTAGIDEPVVGAPVEAVFAPVSGQEMVVGTTITGNAGAYRLWVPPGGPYKVRIPSAMFGIGAPLEPFNATIITGSGFDDNQNQDAVSSASPPTQGVSTAAYTFGIGAQPIDTDGKETGFDAASDNAEDANVNLTIDIGLKPVGLGVGNLVFRDMNADGRFTAGTDQPIPGVVVQLFTATANQTNSTPVAVATSAADGTYFLTAPMSGAYKVYVPASNFASTPTPGPLFGMRSAAGSASTGDDNVGENGIDVNSPSNVGVVSSTFSLGYNSAPTDATYETGYMKTMDNVADTWADLTIDFGFEIAPNGFPLASSRTRAGLTAIVPTGWFYDSITGQIIPGGSVVATGPAGELAMTADGADGSYAFSTTGLSGTVTLTVTPPDGYMLDPARPAQQQAFAPSGTTSTVSVGSAQASGFITDASAAANPWHLEFQIEANDPRPVNNHIPLVPVNAATFAAWQAQNDAGAANENADGDAYENLLEYALGTKADSGVVSQPHFTLASNAQTGGIDAIMIRPVSGHTDLVYALEGGADLAAWSNLGITPVAVVNNDGTETVTYASVDAGAAAGFVRLKVSLDADHNGTPEASATTPAFGWSHRDFATGQQTFSMPLLRNEIFAGAVTAVSGSALEFSVGTDSIKDQLAAGTSYYAEVVSGALAGNRFEIDEARTADGSVELSAGDALNTLGTVPASMVGARVVVRPHWTVGDLLAAQNFNAASSSSASDRLMFLDNGAFKIMWLYSGTSGSRWVWNDDATLADASKRIISPADGLLVHVRGSAVALPVVGQVRGTAFALPLKTGSQMIASGYPVPQSPESRSLTGADCTAGTDAATADRIRLWLGDFTLGGTGYDNHIFELSSGAAQWTHEGDAAHGSENASTLFDAFRASFFMSVGGSAAHVEQSPWTP